MPVTRTHANNQYNSSEEVPSGNLAHSYSDSRQNCHTSYSILPVSYLPSGEFVDRQDERRDASRDNPKYIRQIPELHLTLRYNCNNGTYEVREMPAYRRKQAPRSEPSLISKHYGQLFS